MSPLVRILVLLVCAVVAILVLALANRYRLEHKPRLLDERRQELQAALLEAIQAKSSNQRTIVDIRPFWRGLGVKTYQKKDVILPLVEAGHVTIDSTHESTEYGEFGEFVRNVLTVAFVLPPTHLVLTDSTWTRMVHGGISGTGIIIGRVDTLNWQNAGRDIVSSPQTNAGRDAKVHTDQVTKTDVGKDGIPVDLLIEVVAALRLDARNMENSVERSKVRELANRIETQADEEDPDMDTLEDSIARAERYVVRAGGLMNATYRALEAWQQWRGQG